jgi:hypothetical protein
MRYINEALQWSRLRHVTLLSDRKAVANRAAGDHNQCVSTQSMSLATDEVQR